MEFTTQLHLVLRNEWSYTFTQPVCLCGMERYNFIQSFMEVNRLCGIIKVCIFMSDMTVIHHSKYYKLASHY